MKKFGPLCVAPLFLVLLSGCSVEKEKLYGTWVLESGPDVMPAGTAMEFGSDGKLKMGGKIMGMDVPMTEVGTWEVSGKILTLKVKDRSGKSKDGKARITELTDDKLVIKDDEQPKEAVFKKKK